MSHPPLFPPGLHPVDEAQLEAHFVYPFNGSTTRPALLSGLRAYLQALRQAGVTFEVWLDGSFSTQKVDPNDVDLVVFADPDELNRLPPSLQTYLRGLFDRTTAKRQYGCDVLFAPSSDLNLRSYWRGWYGFDRLEQPKGIARLAVAP
jgi:hypothetical protein